LLRFGVKRVASISVFHGVKLLIGALLAGLSSSSISCADPIHEDSIRILYALGGAWIRRQVPARCGASRFRRGRLSGAHATLAGLVLCPCSNIIRCNKIRALKANWTFQRYATVTILAPHALGFGLSLGMRVPFEDCLD